MSIIKMDSEKIAEIRNALTIILSNAEMTSRKLCKARFLMERIEKEIFKIDRLLPEKNNRWIVINSLTGTSAQIKVYRIDAVTITTNVIKIGIKGGCLDDIRRYNQNSIEAYLEETRRTHESLCSIGAEYRSKEENKQFVEERQEKERYYLEHLAIGGKNVDLEDIYAFCPLWLRNEDFEHLKKQLKSLSDKFALNVEKQKCYVFS